MSSMSEVRQACDRCHTKKLKCTRQPNSISCMRCSRVNADCHFSPVTRPNRMPPGGESAYSSSGAGSDLGADWFNNYPASNHLNGLLAAATGSAPAHDAPLDMDSLPQIMSMLDKIWRGLPPAEMCHISLRDMGQHIEYIAGAAFVGSVLDQVLSVAQQLQTLYHKAVTDATASGHEAGDVGCMTADCIHLQQGAEGGGTRRVDYTALTLLAACHLRLLDILDSISTHGKLCLKMADAVPLAERPQFLLPQLQMGSFVLSQDKMAGMIITMLVDQQRGLVKAAKQLAQCFPNIESQNREVMRRMCEVQNAAATERANTTLSEFSAMGEMFAKVDVFGPGNTV